MLFAQALRSAMFGAFQYEGRSDRLEQWTFSFLTAFLVVAAYVFTKSMAEAPPALTITLFITFFWIFLAHVALFVRRLHDMGRSGLMLFIPALSISLSLVGWLAEIGYVAYHPQIFIEHSWWIFQAGRAGCVLSILILVWVFLTEGEDEENRYGMAP